jgi:hypothetical protein
MGGSLDGFGPPDFSEVHHEQRSKRNPRTERMSYNQGCAQVHFRKVEAMIEFLKILCWGLRKKGSRWTWKRCKLGVWGYTHRKCVLCGRVKALNSGNRCDSCIRASWSGIIEAIDKVAP